MESAQRTCSLTKSLIFFTIAVTLAYLPIAASAECSDNKVKRLSRQGKTITAIASTCDMDADDVSDILKEDSDEETKSRPVGGLAPAQGGGLGPGSPLAPCGCWGPVNPQHREPNQACRSGYAMPRMCPQLCPSGGYAWQGVCG